MVFAELVAFLKAQGKSVLNYLEEIYRRFGLFISMQHSITLPANTSGKCEQIEQWMDCLRLQPPAQLGEWSILFADDYFNQTRRQGEKLIAISLPQTNMIALHLGKEGGEVGKAYGRIMIRPSGTEPKLKFYFELREEILEHESIEQAQSRAQMQISLLADCLFSTSMVLPCN
jgi:phosphomannomutase